MRRIALGLALLCLSACTKAEPTTMDVTVAPDSYCKAYKPKTWSKADTQESIDARRRDNAAWEKACNKAPTS